MTKYEIDFLNDKTYIGEFSLSNSTEAFGQLIYKKNNTFELKLFSDIPLDKGNETIIECIYGKIYDENDNAYFLTLKDCQLYMNTFGSYGYKYQVFFDIALFSRTRTFDFTKDKIKNVSLFYNTWNEFCYPQGFKSYAEYKNKMLSFKIKPNFEISFNQNIFSQYLPKTGIFNTLFCSSNLTKEEKTNIEIQLENILNPYQEKIGIKKIDKHDWLININTVNSIQDIDYITYNIKSLLTCLTHDFSTNINKIKICANNGEEKYDSTFFMLKYIHISSKRSFYDHQRDPFKLNVFDQIEWQKIFKKLFDKKNKLDKFFFILLQNHTNKTITEFSLINYLTCIDAIGNYRKYGKIKYESVLSDFASDLNKNDKIKLLDLFRKELNFVKVNNSNYKKYWGLIGLKISELRALSVHFSNKNSTTDISKCLGIYKTLELIIIDYIFELLEIKKEKRLKYKQYYLSQILRDF